MSEIPIYTHFLENIFGGRKKWSAWVWVSHNTVGIPGNQQIWGQLQREGEGGEDGGREEKEEEEEKPEGRRAFISE